MDKSIKIIVTGVKGQLGYDCVRRLKERGYTNVKGIDIEDLDITDEKAVHSFVLKEKPDVFMHNAAWTAVDKAEQMKDKVYEVNALGPKYIAEACKEVDAKMIYISTDYVFDGKGEKYFEVNDEKNGLSIYGKTKSQGEDFVKANLDKYFIVRISWVFGINGNNFIKTMINLADNGKKELNIVSDQIGSPTYTYDLADLLIDMLESDKYGVYHATNEGVCSWAEFASYVFEVSGREVKVNPTTTEEYLKLVPNQASRPLNSRMSKKSLDKGGFKHLPNWKDAVKRFIFDELMEQITKPIDVDIVCPIYKDSKTLEDLVKSFSTQKCVNIKKIVFPITLSHTEEDDVIREIVKKYKITSFEIEKENFSHSLTREKAMKEYCSSDIVVMISQDIKLTNSLVFYNLVKDIKSGETVYNFARQICTNKSIEKYIRAKNYPAKSYYVNQNDVEKMKFMAYFASDACSAYDRNIFIKVGGYGGYDIMMSEDALYSKIILDAGYKKKYCADAIVEHSHKYTLKQLYKRYYDTGVFQSQVTFFKDVSMEGSGMALALYVLKEALKHFDIPVLFRWLPDMAARYLGIKKGKKSGSKKTEGE